MSFAEIVGVRFVPSNLGFNAQWDEIERIKLIISNVDAHQ